MAHLQTQFISHSRKVCSLYKRALRNLECWVDHRDRLRYQCVLLRARFDQNKDVKDLIEAQKILKGGESELFNHLHPQPKQFPHSPGGIAYEREVIPSDWVLDYWHPIEKAAYPKYFATREQRKKEFIKLWESDFGRK